MFAFIRTFINQFNEYTETDSYQTSYWHWAFLFFAFSYIMQYFTDKNCGTLNEILRVFHQWAVFFIYFGFLAPITDLSYIYLFSFTAMAWWIYQKNTCFLTKLEKMFCGYNDNYRFHDLSYFIDYLSAKVGLSTQFDDFMLHNRLFLLVVLNVFILARLYLFHNGIEEAFTSGSTVGNKKRERSDIEIHGHRGAKNVYPENSIKGFRYTMTTGVDALELDLRLTKDEQIVIFHDEEIDTLQCHKDQSQPQESPASLLIKELELKQIQQYRCEWGEKIPSLEEFIVWLQQSPFPNKYSVKLNIEIKTRPSYDTDDDVRRFVTTLMNTIRQLNIKNPIIIQSFDERALQMVREIDPDMTLSYLVEERDKVDTMIDTAVRLHATYLSPNYNLLSKQRVTEMHDHHLKVLPWVINSTTVFQQMLNMGVDGIITDEPKEMIEYLTSKK